MYEPDNRVKLSLIPAYLLMVVGEIATTDTNVKTLGFFECTVTIPNVQCSVTVCNFDAIRVVIIGW
jgi:hypothetical protein